MRPHSHYEKAQFTRDLAEKGYYLQANVLDGEFMDRARRELALAIEREVQYHANRNYPDYGMVLLCALYGGIFHDMLEYEPLIKPFEDTMGSGCIVYSQTSTSMPPEGGNYSSRIHVDCPRIIPGYIGTMAALILLDDFTEANGATYFLIGSHHSPKPPSDEVFYEKAERLIAPAGSVLFWHPRLWHAGGKKFDCSVAARAHGCHVSPVHEAENRYPSRLKPSRCQSDVTSSVSKVGISSAGASQL